MKLPRDVSGERLIRCLCQRWGYRRAGQVGSQVVLETDTPFHRANLYRQNEELRAARDLLLPRLMSGELAVWHRLHSVSR